MSYLRLPCQARNDPRRYTKGKCFVRVASRNFVDRSYLSDSKQGIVSGEKGNEEEMS
jgi:hypothetical protein